MSAPTDSAAILDAAAAILSGYQGSDAQDTAALLGDLADQLRLGALTPVAPSVPVQHVTEGVNNTVHLAYMQATEDGFAVAGTACNREVYTINHRRRRFFRADRPVTCKRCQKDELA
jgi:hypothetical protein